MNKFFYIIIFFFFSCLDSNPKEINKNVSNCSCDIVYDTTTLTNDFKILRCSNDSLIYLKIIDDTSCYEILETSYAPKRVYYVFKSFYNFKNSFIVESNCGNSDFTCYRLISKNTYQEILSGELLGISEKYKVILYFEDPQTIKAYFPDENKQISYNAPKEININGQLTIDSLKGSSVYVTSRYKK